MNERRKLSVKVAADGSEAELFAPAGMGLGALTRQSLVEVLTQAHVPIDAEIEKRLSEFVAAYAAGEADLTRVIATWTPPSTGEAGRVEWGEGFDPRSAAARGGTSESESVDFYAGRTYAKVTKGTVVGRVLPPTRGKAGRDVCGRPLNGLAGKTASIEFDKTLTCDSNGSIVARTDGMLAFDKNCACVSQMLEISGQVDFSSGHVDFAGDVSIAHGVKSGFKVKAGGALSVDGLIEVADIECGKDLVLRTGMAGAGRGTIAVGGDARVGYLDSVSGAIHGSLLANREIVDCKLAIGNELRCPNGTVFGGEIAVTGSFVVKALGSEAFKPTLVILGDVPLLKASRRETGKAIERVEAKLRQLDEQERCIRLNPRPSAAEKERLTEFAFERSELSQERLAKSQILEEMDRAIKSAKKLDVQISKAVYANVRLRVGEYTVLFKDVVKGPLAIFWDPQGHLLCKLGSQEARPLSTIATVMRDAAESSARTKAA